MNLSILLPIRTHFFRMHKGMIQVEDTAVFVNFLTLAMHSLRYLTARPKPTTRFLRVRKEFQTMATTWAFFAFFTITFLSSNVLSFSYLQYRTIPRNVFRYSPAIDSCSADTRRGVTLGSTSFAFDRSKVAFRVPRCRRLQLFSEIRKDGTNSESVGEIASDSPGSIESVDRIDLAISAQQRFQGVEDSENELKRKSATQDVLYLGLGALGIAALILGTLTAGLPPSLPLILVFAIGYLAIIYESAVDINKSSSALLMAVVSWCLVGHAGNLGLEQVLTELDKSLAGVSQIFFFLLSAMTVVETVDAHEGFSFITDKIRTTDKRTLLLITSTVTFFLSAVLDNLTTTIVMCSLLSRLISDEDRETRKVGMPTVGFWNVSHI